MVFTSVHGDMHGAHGLFRKGWPHEESVRVPLLVRMRTSRLERPVEVQHGRAGYPSSQGPTREAREDTDVEPGRGRSPLIPHFALFLPDVSLSVRP